MPRHCFAPEVTPEEVYSAPEGIITKYNDPGKFVSSVSAPWLHARMPEPARIARRMTVLEIGRVPGTVSSCCRDSPARIYWRAE